MKPQIGDCLGWLVCLPLLPLLLRPGQRVRAPLVRLSLVPCRLRGEDLVDPARDRGLLGAGG